jgi:phosphatidylserine decarboxylase
MKHTLAERLWPQGELNFLLTNRIPRIAATRFMGWFSRIRQPWVARASIAAWRSLSDLDLSDAAEARFDSLHACFTRALRPGARPIDADPAVLASPCDAIVGACGRVEGTRVWQAKGYPYDMGELFGRVQDAAPWREGCYATLRLTPTMYHRFHAPHDAVLEQVSYFSGDVWNVNPPALARVAGLYCRNERAVLRLRLAGGHAIALVPVAAILVASLRLHAPDLRLHLGYQGPRQIDCDHAFAKGDEIGWFEHGSTVIVFAPAGFSLAAGIEPGARIRMGQALMRLPPKLHEAVIAPS